MDMGMIEGRLLGRLVSVQLYNVGCDAQWDECFELFHAGLIVTQFPNQGGTNVIVVWDTFQKTCGNGPPQGSKDQWSPRIEDLQGSFVGTIFFPSPNPTVKDTSTLSLDGTPNVTWNDCSQHKRTNDEEYSKRRCTEFFFPALSLVFFLCLFFAHLRLERSACVGVGVVQSWFGPGRLVRKVSHRTTCPD